MIALHWERPAGNGWHKLDSIDITKIRTIGIFIIWHEGDPGRVIRVCQGDVGRQLQLEQISPPVLRYRVFGELCVTWASVPASFRNGVERYLANLLRPQVGESYPLTLPLAANSPL
ncbi:MAG: hypothetical protein H6883_09675 [Rhodobiaceae bacterium]|nr:hypothetical protein [Rhodobiaceae bacterium]MCC0056396.1 hypothetical protein [Rhodobiaceae bacterium]